MLWFVFCRSSLLLKTTPTGSYAIPDGANPPVRVPNGAYVHDIPPMNDGKKVKTFYAGDTLYVPDGYALFMLRQSFRLLNCEQYAKAGKCAEMLYWDRHTRFCGVRGSPMEMHSGISKRCTACGREVWPGLSIAVITLVTRGDDVLLVKARNFEGDYYGLVAGIDETGETLEDAAAREIREETGIEVDNMRYVLSQPWPYPCGLMAGFAAEYKSGEIVLQQSELSAGGWFGKDALPPLPDESGVARKMIMAWKTNKI